MAYIVTYNEMMSKDSMQALCPSAKMRLECRLLGCCLVLRRFFAGAVFSIEQGVEDDSAPAVVWEIDEAEEKDLREYYPEDLYERIAFLLVAEKSKAEKIQMEVFMFVLRCGESALPDEERIEKIAAAYEEHNFDFWYVEQAMDNAADSMKGGKEDGIIHAGTAGTGEQHQP